MKILDFLGITEEKNSPRTVQSVLSSISTVLLAAGVISVVFRAPAAVWIGCFIVGGLLLITSTVFAVLKRKKD